MKKIVTAAVCVSALGLAGCSHSGSSSNGGGNNNVIAGIFALTEEDTVSSRFIEGNPVTFNTLAKAIIRNFNNDTTELDQFQVAVQLVGNVQEPTEAESAAPAARSLLAEEEPTQFNVIATVNGEKVTFTRADLMEDGSLGKELSDGREIYIWQFAAETWLDLVENDDLIVKYVMPVGFNVETNEDGVVVDGVAVSGMETRPQALRNKANATYEGYVWTRSYPSNEPSGEARDTGAGELILEADFERGKISGEMENVVGGPRRLETRQQLLAVEEDSIRIVETDIEGNGFSTTLESEYLNIKESEFEGKFYGPNGEEAGGTLSMVVEGEGFDDVPRERVAEELETVDQNVIGVWIAEERKMDVYRDK